MSTAPAPTGGLAALLGMLSSRAPGIIVDIDNGYGAGAAPFATRAARVARAAGRP